MTRKKPNPLTEANRLLADYWQLLNAGQAPEPEEFLKHHPQVTGELRPLLQTSWDLHAQRLAPRPIGPEARRRIIRRVMLPLLRQAALRVKERAAELTGKTAFALKSRSDLILLLLHLPGQSDKPGEGVQGMLRMMKLIFLAQKTTPAASRLDLAYEFVPWRFGPSSSEVYDDLQTLIWADLVTRTEYDSDGLPVVIRNDYGQMQEADFSSSNALFELTPEGKALAERLARYLEQNQPELLKQLSALKQRLARLTWQQIVVKVYADFPQYAVESELLPQIRKTQTDFQPE